MKIMPKDYFTPQRLRGRKKLPPVLFHWTRGLENALQILDHGFLRGRPGLSTTENPAFGVPGPVVFVLSPKAILSRGFTLWPVFYRQYAQEAEWVVAAADAEKDGDHIFTSTVRLPLRGVLRLVGYTPGWTHPRKRDKVRELRAAARRADVRVRMFDWPEWWKNGVRVPRRGGRR